MAKRGRKSRRPTTASSTDSLPSRFGWRLPALAQPVMRWPKKDPASWGVGVSDIGCSACMTRCSLLAAPLRSICEDLCAVTCTG